MNNTNSADSEFRYEFLTPTSTGYRIALPILEKVNSERFNKETVLRFVIKRKKIGEKDTEGELYFDENSGILLGNSLSDQVRDALCAFMRENYPKTFTNLTNLRQFTFNIWVIVQGWSKEELSEDELQLLKD